MTRLHAPPLEQMERPPHPPRLSAVSTVITEDSQMLSAFAIGEGNADEMTSSGRWISADKWTVIDKLEQMR